MMKTLLPICAALALATGSIAQAGGLAPEIAPQVVVIAEPEPQSSVNQLVVPLILLGLLAAVGGGGTAAATGAGQGGAPLPTVNGGTFER